MTKARVTNVPRREGSYASGFMVALEFGVVVLTVGSGYEKLLGDLITLRKSLRRVSVCRAVSPCARAAFRRSELEAVRSWRVRVLCVGWKSQRFAEKGSAGLGRHHLRVQPRRPHRGCLGDKAAKQGGHGAEIEGQVVPGDGLQAALTGGRICMTS